MNKKVLFSTDRFDVIEKDGRTGVEPHHLSVAVLPFVRDVRGLPLQLGIIKEYNKIKSKDTYTVITGRVEGEDPDILSAAQSKMLDTSGLDVQEPERWFYLGFIQTHKMINQEIPCFACDITGMSLPVEEDDDKVDKEKVEFNIVGVNQALDTDDCYIPTLFMKMFRYIFGHGDNKVDDQKNKTTATKGAEQVGITDIVEIDGVIGAGKNDEGWTIHVKAGADKDAISSRVASILGEDVPFKIEVTKEIKPE